MVTIEKAGYSFGFVANMLYMMPQMSPGKYPMTHYACCTALMHLVLVPTQMISGPLADHLGHKTYFIFVCFASISSLIAAYFAPAIKTQADGSLSTYPIPDFFTTDYTDEYKIQSPLPLSLSGSYRCNPWLKNTG